MRSLRPAALLLAVAAFGASVARGGGEAPPAPPNLVLVSMDTTRYDALSCDGHLPGIARDLGVTTPHLDALAAEGIRFERFYAHAPTTLNSHASMLTGLDPHGHAVPRNGFPLDPKFPTLATRLQAAGYDTIAILGSLALARDMGLSKGFRVYDDHMSEKLGPMFQDRAEGVVDRTFAALHDRDATKPLFLWVHFYDAHAPYVPPSPWDTKYGDPAYHGGVTPDDPRMNKLRDEMIDGVAKPEDVDRIESIYEGEVGYMDDQIGRLVDGLKSRGVLDHALLVLVGDHGEILSDVPDFAFTHGNDVTDGSLHVPLIWRGYGVPVAERAVVHRQAEMAGLAPTIEQALGLEPTLGDHGSFWDLVRPGPVDDAEGWPERPVRPIVEEATRPHSYEDHKHWNNLKFRRGVRAGGWSLVGRLDKPSVLLRGDGADASADEAPIQPVLEGIVRQWDAKAPPHRVEGMDDATRDALKALGYVDGPGDGAPQPVDNSENDPD